jgi:hypothetical protein
MGLWMCHKVARALNDGRAGTLAATAGRMANTSFETPLPLVSNATYAAQRIDDRSLHAKPRSLRSRQEKGPSWSQRIQSLTRGTYPLIRAIAARYPPCHCCACS